MIFLLILPVNSVINTCVLINAAAGDGCVTGDVRLVGGVANSSSGLVEVCVDGVWGHVCDSSYEWTNENAEVVCRQLSLPTHSIIIHYTPTIFINDIIFRCICVSWLYLP